MIYKGISSDLLIFQVVIYSLPINLLISPSNQLRA